MHTHCGYKYGFGLFKFQTRLLFISLVSDNNYSETKKYKILLWFEKFEVRPNFDIYECAPRASHNISF